MPLVSVIIPTYNAGPYLLEAIESVLDQSFKDFEIIVVDDASDDDTEERLRPIADRIVYIRQNHAGSAVARNRGILSASGRYIAFLDADDLWLRDKLEKQVALMEENPGAVVVVTGHNRLAHFTNSDGKARAAPKFAPRKVEFLEILRQPVIHTSSVMVRRDALAEAGIFDPRLINAQDWDLWVRLASIGEVVGIEKVLTQYRLHESQSTRSIEYLRNVILADQIMLARFRYDKQTLPYIKEKLGRDYWVLGLREAKNDHRFEARAAYFQCVRYRYNVLQALARIFVYSLPAFLVDRIQKLRDARATGE
jgi:glycosyltransferase involved in cell wall biosynthesis